MTFVTAVVGSLIRAVVVTAFVLVVSRSWSGWLNQWTSRWRGIAWGWTLVPGFIPELLLGYAYAPWVIGQSIRAEIVCAVLLGLRLLPVGVIAWQLTPTSPLSPSAWHLRQMTGGHRPGLEWLRFVWVDSLRPSIPTAALVGLLAFQEFELAALLRAVSWTDWLFVDQVGGRAFVDLVRAASIPSLLQMLVILGAIFCLRSNHDRLNVSVENHVSRRPYAIVAPIVWGTISWVFLIIVPLSSLMSGLPDGLAQLAGQTLRWQGLLRELLGGCAVSVTAACAAWGVAGGVPSIIDRGRRQGWGIALMCLPGLSGALVLSLGLLALFQRSLLSRFYDTPVMWVLASILFLLPRAVLLRLWLHHAGGSSITVAQNLSASPNRAQQRTGRSLLWRLRDEPQFFAVCFLAYASYLELTLAALLAPTGVPSGLVRLYNFLHFGRTSALSAEMVVLLGIPLLVAAGVWGLARKGRV